MKQAAMSGLLATGSRCSDGGVMPTPTLALAVKRFDAGIMITASHNPPQYNGIKLLNPDGSAFDDNQTNQIEEIVLSDVGCVAPWNEISKGNIYDEAVEQHIERILLEFPGKLNVKVVLDCGCGAGAMITPYLLRRLGCEVITMNCYPSGYFPRGMEPTADNLGHLIRVTKEFGANLGIAHDGDADRMMVIDNKGRFVSGDKLMVILGQSVGARELVTTIDASMVIDEIGINVARTRVGDPYVSNELRRKGDFGGEPSGSWIFPNVSLCPDGVYAAAHIVNIASQYELSSLVDKIPSYPLLRGSISGGSIVMPKLEQRLAATKPLSVSCVDGLKLHFEDGWLLVRPSGTEPIVRVTAEARSLEKANQLYNSAIEIIEACMERGEA
jgi:phosphoglucosamine mutase